MKHKNVQNKIYACQLITFCNVVPITTNDKNVYIFFTKRTSAYILYRLMKLVAIYGRCVLLNYRSSQSYLIGYISGRTSYNTAVCAFYILHGLGYAWVIKFIPRYKYQKVGINSILENAIKGFLCAWSICIDWTNYGRQKTIHTWTSYFALFQLRLKWHGICERPVRKLLMV